jgi:catechol 2,3-dioxygenase-like lactoylglutathione lyase family enzyme
MIGVPNSSLEAAAESKDQGGRMKDELKSRRYVDSTEQLVTEIVVKDIKRSVNFYRRLGFELLRDGGDFVELTWEDHRLFLAELSAFRDAHGATPATTPTLPLANVRVMVPNVDEYWKLVNEIGAQIIIPLANRYYGLRDFTIADPDGFGVRFASVLPDAASRSVDWISFV